MEVLGSMLMRKRASRLRRSSFRKLADDSFPQRIEMSDEVVDNGSFAQIVKGWDSLTGKMVAVKIMSKASIRGVQKKFLDREIEALDRLNHRYILELVMNYEDSKKVYIASEFCEGGNLLYKTAELGSIPENISAQIIIHLAEALMFCHKNGIVHRDIKPENIFISKAVDDLTDFSWSKSLKIGDFGCSAVLDQAKTKLNQIQKLKTRCGSLGYMAPEVVLGKAYDHTCDAWGLGIVLFVMISGYHPFIDGNVSEDEISKRITKGKFIKRNEAWSNISKTMKTVVFSLLALKPQKRLKLKDVRKLLLNKAPQEV